MARYERSTFLCDQIERCAVAELAARLCRSQSDAVRFVVVEAAQQLIKADALASLYLRLDPAKQEADRATG